MPSQKKSPPKSKYKYVGPYFKRGHLIGSTLYNPDAMTDAEIEALMKKHNFTEKWWKLQKT